MALKVGEKAPDFYAVTDEGNTISLEEKLKEGPVVLYFYPKDETPGCVAEACAFRDNWEEIRKLGATVLGVSSDPVDSHRRFKENRKLQFTLLSDPDKEIRRKYGATGTLLPPRITYIIDKNGVIREVYNSQLNAATHAQVALKALHSLTKEK
ncbi:MAG: peroxiredoxin [Thermoplasmata archaeon]